MVTLLEGKFSPPFFFQSRRLVRIYLMLAESMCQTAFVLLYIHTYEKGRFQSLACGLQYVKGEWCFLFPMKITSILLSFCNSHVKPKRSSITEFLFSSVAICGSFSLLFFFLFHSRWKVLSQAVLCRKFSLSLPLSCSLPGT